MTNYAAIRVERKTAEYTVINSSIEKRAQNREKPLVVTTILIVFEESFHALRLNSSQIGPKV